MTTPIQLLTERLHEILDAEAHAEACDNKKDLPKIRMTKKRYELAIHSIQNFTHLSRFRMKQRK